MTSEIAFGDCVLRRQEKGEAVSPQLLSQWFKRHKISKNGKDRWNGQREGVAKGGDGYVEDGQNARLHDVNELETDLFLTF